MKLLDDSVELLSILFKECSLNFHSFLHFLRSWQPFSTVVVYKPRWGFSKLGQALAWRMVKLSGWPGNFDHDNASSDTIPFHLVEQNLKRYTKLIVIKIYLEPNSSSKKFLSWPYWFKKASHKYSRWQKDPPGEYHENAWKIQGNKQYG